MSWIFLPNRFQSQDDAKNKVAWDVVYIQFCMEYLQYFMPQHDDEQVIIAIAIYLVNINKEIEVPSESVGFYSN